MTKRTQPKAPPIARVYAMLTALALCGLIFVLLRELWSMRTGSQLESWLRPFFSLIGDVRYQPWMYPAGIAGVVVGILFVLGAMWPRRKTHWQTNSSATTWVRPVDVARMCTAAAEKVPGVIRATTASTAHRTTVYVTGDPTDAELEMQVIDAVQPVVDQLDPKPAVHVRIQNRGEARP